MNYIILYYVINIKLSIIDCKKIIQKNTKNIYNLFAINWFNFI